MPLRGLKSNLLARLTSTNLMTVLVVLAIVAILIALTLPQTRSSREPSRRSHCKSNLHNIGLALWNYHEEWKTFPPAYTVDESGYRLHSWRTLLLPYIDQKELYSRIDLSKPWDDPVNAKARETSLDAYSCPSDPGAPGSTRYLAIVGPNSFLSATGGRAMSEITDDHATTLAVIEVDPRHAVPWMSPLDADEELVLSLDPLSKNWRPHTGGTHALFADGHVALLSAELARELPADQRRAMMTISH